MKTQPYNLKIHQKLLLSIYPLLNIAYFIEYIFISKIPLENYKYISLGLLILTIIQIIILIKRLTILKVDTDKKAMYIFLFLSIVLFHFYYVWVLDDKFVLKTKKQHAEEIRNGS